MSAPQWVAVVGHDGGDLADVAVEHGDVVRDVGQGVVDLVRHPGHELAEAGHLLALDEVRLRLLELAEGRLELVLAAAELVLGLAAGTVEPVPVERPAHGGGHARGVQVVLGHVVVRALLQQVDGHALAPPPVTITTGRSSPSSSRIRERTWSPFIRGSWKSRTTRSNSSFASRSRPVSPESAKTSSKSRSVCR